MATKKDNANEEPKKDPRLGVFDAIKRTRTELVALIILTVAIWFLPIEAKEGLLALFITKTMFVSLGVLYAHASRKFLFPYMDFVKARVEENWSSVIFLAVWYGVIVWAFAVGG